MDKIRLRRKEKHDMTHLQSWSAAFFIFLLLVLSANNAGAIKVTPSKFDHFNLTVPEKIIAGESFVIKITAQDSYGNLIADFSESGREFALSASGPATIQPLRLSPALFEGGATNVTVTARDAGKMSIFISDISTGKKIQRLDVSVGGMPGQTENAAESLKDTGKAKEPRKAVSKLTETGKKKAADKTAKPSKKDIRKESVNEKKKAIVVSKTRESRKTASPPTTNTKEPTKKIPENRKGEKLFSISDISILEAGEKALLVIKSPSPAEPPEYKKTLETRQGKKVIKLSLKPAVKKTDSLVKLQSELIGDIHVEEDIKEREAVNLYIELKTGPAFSDIAAQKDALIVMLSKIRK